MAYVNYNATRGNLCHKKHKARAEVLFDALRRNAARLRAAGCAVVSGPRTTGDGCYESCVAGPEGVLVEITV